MNNTWWVALTFPMVSLGCSPLYNPLHAPQGAKTRSVAAQAGPVKVAKKQRKAPVKSTQAVGSSEVREVGDYFVHRFSGSFRPGPLTLVERVVAEKEGTVIIDYTLEDGVSEKTLRVHFDHETMRPVTVAELSEEGETIVPLSAYEAMLEQTVFAPDVNEALVDEKSQTCLVGPKELDCEVKQYQVSVGDQQATLTVTRSQDLPGRDLAGEITAVDGSVIYRAELVETGNAGRADSSVAAK